MRQSLLCCRDFLDAHPENRLTKGVERHLELIASNLNPSRLSKTGSSRGEGLPKVSEEDTEATALPVGSFNLIEP